MADKQHPQIRDCSTRRRTDDDKPFAITLDPRLVAGQPHRLVAHRAPGLSDRLPPCNHQCPAGENIQGWLFHAESGNYEAAWRT
jgi:hypothetical protein